MDRTANDEIANFLSIRAKHLAAMRQSVVASAKGTSLNISRMPVHLKRVLSEQSKFKGPSLSEGKVHLGDAKELLKRVLPESVALSVWSPPYFVGKSYESHLTFEKWQALLKTVIKRHFAVVKPGGFLVINIADILCFRDKSIPKIQAEVIGGRRSSVTREDVLNAMAKYPSANRHKLARVLGCSEQTVDRRLNGNNIRGGKYETQTRVKLVGGLIESWALQSGFYPYDRRIWVKDAAWENSRWANSSYRAVDEFEYIYILWKPGVTTVDRSRLGAQEWKTWGMRAVWHFPSVRMNDDHEAKFPIELPRRAIRLLTDPGDLVLDCFLGSGTTALAAIEQGREFVGIEMDPKYVELANLAISKMLRFPNADKSKQLDSGSRKTGSDRKIVNEARSASSL